jgi:hypothetical protein
MGGLLAASHALLKDPMASNDQTKTKQTSRPKPHLETSDDTKAKKPSQHFYVPKWRRSDKTVKVATDVEALAVAVGQTLNIGHHLEGEESTVQDDADSWDRLYDDSGKCKDENLLKEVDSTD